MRGLGCRMMLMLMLRMGTLYREHMMGGVCLLRNLLSFSASALHAGMGRRDSVVSGSTHGHLGQWKQEIQGPAPLTRRSARHLQAEASIRASEPTTPIDRGKSHSNKEAVHRPRLPFPSHPI